MTATSPHLVDELRTRLAVDSDGPVSRAFLSRLLDYVELLTAENATLRQVCSAFLDIDGVSDEQLEAELAAAAQRREGTR